jgi:hypothetical protein
MHLTGVLPRAADGRVPASSGSMRIAMLLWLAVMLLLPACSQTQRQSSGYGSTHAFRSQQPPEQAARCFARNAEEHSSALAAEVIRRDTGADVVVRVKNGVTYATAEFRPSGGGSTASITLMVVSSGRQSDLLGSLTEGC